MTTLRPDTLGEPRSSSSLDRPPVLPDVQGDPQVTSRDPLDQPPVLLPELPLSSPTPDATLPSLPAEAPPVLTPEQPTLVADYPSDGECDRPWSTSAAEEKASEHFRKVLNRVAESVGFEPKLKPPKQDTVSLSSLSGASAHLVNEEKDVKRLAWPWPESLKQAAKWVQCSLQGKPLTAEPVKNPVGDKTLMPPTTSWIKPSVEKLEWRTDVVGDWPISPPSSTDVLPDFKPAASFSMPRSSVLSTEESIRRLTSLSSVQDHLFSALQNVVRDLAEDRSPEAADRALDEAADLSRLFAAASGRALMTGLTAATNLQTMRRDEALASIKGLPKEDAARARSLSFLGEDLFGVDREGLRSFLKDRREEQASQAVLSSLSRSLQSSLPASSSGATGGSLKGFTIPKKQHQHPFRGGRGQGGQSGAQTRPGRSHYRGSGRGRGNFAPRTEHQSQGNAGRGRGESRGRGDGNRSYHDKRNAKGRFTQKK